MLGLEWVEEEHRLRPVHVPRPDTSRSSLVVLAQHRSDSRRARDRSRVFQPLVREPIASRGGHEEGEHATGSSVPTTSDERQEPDDPLPAGPPLRRNQHLSVGRAALLPRVSLAAGCGATGSISAQVYDILVIRGSICYGPATRSLCTTAPSGRSCTVASGPNRLSAGNPVAASSEPPGHPGAQTLQPEEGLNAGATSCRPGLADQA